MENTTQKQETLALINQFAEIAYDNGFTDGLDVGKQVGFVAGVGF